MGTMSSFEARNMANRYKELANLVLLYEHSITGRKELAKKIEKAYISFVTSINTYKKKFPNEDGMYVLIDELYQRASHIMFKNFSSVQNMSDTLETICSAANVSYETYAIKEYTYPVLSTISPNERKLYIVAPKYLLNRAARDTMQKSILGFCERHGSFLIVSSPSVSSDIKTYAKKLNFTMSSPHYEVIGKLIDDRFGKFLSKALAFVDENGTDLEGIDISALRTTFNKRKNLSL